MDFLQLAQNRYSCRKLSGEAVPQAQIDAILTAARLAPTGKNIQPFKVWVFQSEDALRAMYDATRFTFGAKLFFVVGAKKEDAWVRPYDEANFAVVDASIVATHMMLEIEQLGLGTTWVGYFDAPKLQAQYPEMQGYDLIAVFPVGAPLPDAAPSPRHGESKPDAELFAVK